MTLEEYETLRRNYIQGMKKKNKNDARQMIRAANNASELQKKLAVRKKLKEKKKLQEKGIYFSIKSNYSPLAIEF